MDKKDEIVSNYERQTSASRRDLPCLMVPVPAIYVLFCVCVLSSLFACATANPHNLFSSLLCCFFDSFRRQRLLHYCMHRELISRTFMMLTLLFFDV